MNLRTRCLDPEEVNKINSKLITLLFAITLLGGCVSGNVRDTIQKNPDIVFDVIEENPERFLEVVNRAADMAKRKHYENRAAETAKRRETDVGKANDSALKSHGLSIAACLSFDKPAKLRNSTLYGTRITSESKVCR